MKTNDTFLTVCNTAPSGYVRKLSEYLTLSITKLRGHQAFGGLKEHSFSPTSIIVVAHGMLIYQKL